MDKLGVNSIIKKSLLVAIVIILGLALWWQFGPQETVFFGNELEKADLIRLDTPRPNQVISSPLTIRGEARGYWFFEASFPVVLVNWDGLIIAQGIATAQDEWMTEEFVPFEAAITFTVEKDVYSNRGSLILRKDNPSGLPENDDALEIPVIFEETDKATSVALSQKFSGGGVSITPLEVVSDSRCPVDVVCIWAGEVSLKVRLEKGTVSREVILKLGIPVTFEESKISLTSVTPENNSKRPFNKEDYRFTFLITPLSVGEIGTISGTVTTSPTCPVERIPPEPQCAPRPYATSIEIRQTGETSVLKTIKSDTLGIFNTELSVGSYELRAANDSIFPNCNSVTIQVKSGQNSVVNISCDTGIR